MQSICDNEVRTNSYLAELSRDVTTSLVNEAHISQPACTAIQLALTDLLFSWGVLPTAVAGHSSGEIGAAYAAGILSLESCMAIAYYRGVVTIELKKRFPELRGAMMAIGCSKEEIEPLIAQLTLKDVKIACFNSPESLTISGDEPAIDQLQTMMQQKEMFNRKLQVDVAYHSHHMKLIARSYLEYLQLLDLPKSTPVKFHSSLLGRLVNGLKLEPSYWVENLTESVRFSEALASMCGPTGDYKTGVNMIVEIGPHSALAGPVKQILKACAMKIPYASALVRKRDAVETAQELASALFVKGATLNLGAINLQGSTKLPTLLVDMPRYPWNHQNRYWHESRMTQKHRNRTTQRNDILGTLANYSNDLEPIWRNILRIDDLPWLQHHKIQSLTLFPISGFIAMALEAASQRATSRNIHYDNIELRNVAISKPLMIGDDGIEVTLQLRPRHGDALISSDFWDEFRIHSWAADMGWTEHCKGLIATKVKDGANVNSCRIMRESEMALHTTITDIKTRAVVPIDKVKLYDGLSELGVSYGPSFQGMDNCHTGEDCSTANVAIIDTAQDMPQGYQTSMIIQPTILEKMVEMYWPILGAGRASINTVYLPSSIARMTVSRDITEQTKTPGNSLRIFCEGIPPQLHPKPMQVSMFATGGDDAKEALIVITDLTISPILDRDISSEGEAHRELCYKLDWEPILQSIDPLGPNGSSSVAVCHPNGQQNGISNGVPNGLSCHLNGQHTGTSNGLSNGKSQFLTTHQNGAANGVANGNVEHLNDVSIFPEGLMTIVHGDSDLQRLLASRLADDLEISTRRRPETGTLAHVKPDHKLCLFLTELDQPLLSSLTSGQFTSLQKVLTSVQGILWVVRGAYSGSQNPDVNMVTGLSRSIRSETLLKFATLDLDPKCVLCIEDTIRAILEVFRAAFGSKAEANCELEFMERNGSFFTPRIVNDTEMNEYVHTQTKASILEPTLFFQDERSLKLTIGAPGVFETLHFVDQSMEDHLPDDEVEIEVKAIGMNSRDLTTAMGHLNTYDFGLECSGTITKVGNKVENFSVGDRIAGISVSGGVYSTYAHLKAQFVFKIKDNMSFEDAASIPVAYCTAHYGLLDIGHVQEGERVLIHGANSASGQAAIFLAQMKKAEVFATINNTKSKELLINMYGVRDDHIFSFHDFSSRSTIRQATGHGLFDVVLNCIPTDVDELRDVLDHLSNFGRFIDIGTQDANSRLETVRFQNNRSFMSVDLITMALERPKLIQRLLANICNLLTDSKINHLNFTTMFPISEVESAFKLLHSGKADGKLVLSPRLEDKVKVCTPQLFACFFLKLMANDVSGNSFEKGKPTPSRCFIYPDRWYRWAWTKHDQVDGWQRSQEYRFSFQRRICHWEGQGDD